ncbi:retrovirus-related pol polyprotein from transposon TNT 1-94 [Tanacetum coccineum]
MSKEFWTKAVDYAVYLLNRCPSKSLDNKTLQEAWNGMKPIDVFVGYYKQSKGYKLYNAITRKVVVSRDVEYEEKGSWDWSIKESERYDFLPMSDEEETCESGEEVQQPQRPNTTPIQDSPSSSCEGEPKTRSLQELYESNGYTRLRKNAKHEVEKYKARLVAKGYKQKHEIDYEEDVTKIYVDKKSAIDLAKNSVYHDRSKHINNRYHFIRECIARKDIRVIHTRSKDQVVDIFTKAINERDFTRQRMMLRVGKSSLKEGLGS